MQALLLPLGDDLYALELRTVREVLVAPPTTPVPGAPATVVGVFNLHGEVVPLLDTARLLGVGDAGPAAYAAVADTGAGIAGLTAGGMPESAWLGDTAGRARLPGTVARFRTGTRVVTLIALDELVERL